MRWCDLSCEHASFLRLRRWMGPGPAEPLWPCIAPGSANSSQARSVSMRQPGRPPGRSGPGPAPGMRRSFGQMRFFAKSQNQEYLSGRVEDND